MFEYVVLVFLGRRIVEVVEIADIALDAAVVEEDSYALVVREWLVVDLLGSTMR